MLLLVQSKPDSCPVCSSQKLYPVDKTAKAPTAFRCPDCSNLLSVKVNKPVPAISAHLSRCPHCTTVGEIEIHGGVEWCGYCGLDPSAEQPSSALARLWKPDSGIRRFMERDSEILKPNAPKGVFLRKWCGPHCTSADACTQSSRNLVECLKEWEKDGSEAGEEDMGKKRRKHRKHRCHSANKPLNPPLKKERGARVQCAKDGWLEKAITHGTENQESSGATGSG